MPDEHKKPLQLATAAWMQLHALTQAYQAAVMRGADSEELESIRRETHDVLDSMLDLNAEAAVAVRSIIQG
jgi:hypothetical protein